MKAFSIFIILVGFQIAGLSQQDPMFTTYMFNSLTYNPAYAGSQGNWDVNASYRRQWTGFDGSPSTVLLSGEGPVASGKVGLGITLFNDQIGIESRTDLSTNYSYIMNTGNGSLSLGLKLGFAFYNLKFSSLIAQDPNDPIYTGEQAPSSLYFGPGILYQNSSFYFGLSSPNIAATPIKKNNSSTESVKSHYYAQAGGWIDLGSSGVQFRPSILVSYENSAPLQFNLNAGFLFNQSFGAGLSYRSGDAVNLNAVFYPSADFRIGLAYDFTLSELNEFTNSTFEVMVGYSFGDQITKIANPR